jgi:hypothetical protein
MRPVSLLRPLHAFAACFALALSLAVAGTAFAYHTHFVANNCNTNPPQYTDYITRDGSMTVALYARHEGYQWGGGCWNDNNVDDSPNDPIQDPNTGGEGGDCSGFTFKVWRESTNVNDSGAWQWNKLRNVHGPYVAGNFKSGYGAPHVTYWKGGLIRMDALASDSHVGMIYSANADGTDQMIEAKGEAYGTNIWTRTYRGDSSYGGARRLGWNA